MERYCVDDADISATEETEAEERNEDENAEQKLRHSTEPYVYLNIIWVLQLFFDVAVLVVLLCRRR